MRHMLFTGLVLLFVFCGGAFATTPEYRDGYLLVRFNETGVSATSNTTRQAVINAAGGGTIEKMFTTVPGLGLVKLPAGVSVLTAKSKFGTAIGVKYAEPDFIVRIKRTPNDLRFNELWGLNNTGQQGGLPGADIKATSAWDINTGSQNIVVAVIDSGVDYTHPDLAANMWVNQAELSGLPGVDDDGNGYVDDIYGYNFFGNNGNPMDDDGHGTHVAGTIGAVGNNALGVTGVCWRVRIMALRFLGPDGGATSGAIRAIEYAVMNGVKISNNSWGGPGYSQAVYDAIAAARAAGHLFVAAAGNAGYDNDIIFDTPTSYNLDNILAVLATNRNDQRVEETWWSSNYGRTTVDVGAPGLDILSTIPGGGYAAAGGTSMASPHVAGAAALVLATNPNLNYLQVKHILTSTVDKLSSLNDLCVTEGRINVYRAVLAAQAEDRLPPTPNPAQWDIEPTATGLRHIVMRAAAASDPSGVQYRFECLEDSSLSTNTPTGWADSRVHQVFTAAEGTTYTFRVRYRDKSARQNTGSLSEAVAATTAAGIDTLTPAPNPSLWKAVPRRLTNTQISMEIDPSYDENGVEYRFVCIGTTNPYYTDPNYPDRILGLGTNTPTGWTDNTVYTEIGRAHV